MSEIRIVSSMGPKCKVGCLELRIKSKGRKVGTRNVPLNVNVNTDT